MCVLMYCHVMSLCMDKAIAWLVCRLFVDMFVLENKVCRCLIGDDLLMLIYVTRPKNTLKFL